MSKRLSIGAVLFFLAVGTSAAQIDHQALMGEWQGTWNMRTSDRQFSGPITVTVLKVENGKVYGKTESTNVRGESTPTVNWVTNATPTGWYGVNKDGFPTTVTFDGKTLTVITQRGAQTITSVLLKK
jgi:hypothetical protein